MEYLTNGTISAIIMDTVIIGIVLFDHLTRNDRAKLKDHEFDVGDCRSCRDIREPYLTCARFETQDGASEWVLTCAMDSDDLKTWATNYAITQGWEFLGEEDPMDVVNTQYDGIATLSTGGWL